MADVENTSIEDMEKMYEEMFNYRYTDEDPDYIMTVAQPIPPCPCVSGYYTRSRNQDNRKADISLRIAYYCKNQDRRGGWRGRGQGHWQGRGGYHGNNRGEDQGRGSYNENYRGGGRGGYHGNRNEGQGHYRRNYDQGRDGGYNRHSGDRYRPY